MISDGSCDTDDSNEKSNDVENLVLHHMNKLQFKIYYNR